ncbi:MAG: sugar ABC transporter permease [Bacillota bacterium]|jgi:multiple sugar transport system permease protein|nr:sugar ABC transporter permease [Bacillota bacterium]HOO31269.1 sugar ABC transporter permease [Bacillota bacterium]HPQ03126.1 sugar ABC transporter permease [Bacillota bacterium]
MQTIHENKRKRSKGLSANAWSYVFIAPAMIGFFVFRAFPIGFAVWVSLTDWELIGPPPSFVGVQNYVQAFHDPVFGKAFANTLAFTLMTALGAALVGLIFAALLDRNIRGSKFFRTSLYVPVITPVVAVVRIWTWLYSPSPGGLFNWVAGLFGSGPYRWIMDPDMALPSLALMTIWQGFGWDMVIILAGLKGIPNVFYEAATVDGASWWDKFAHITLPLLRPVMLFVFIMGGINGFKTFAQPYLMQGPMNSTLTTSLYIFQNAFDNFRMGYAAALSFIVSVVIMLLSVVQFRAFGGEEGISYE